MNIRWKKNAVDSADATSIAMLDVENSIRDLVRKDLRLSDEQEDDDRVGLAPTDLAPAGVDAVIRRVAGASLEEIEILIAELRGVRDIMHAEGQRVQRELSGYARLSHTAMKSTRAIADNVAEWKRAVDDLQHA
ncbi:MAG: hypothetical protein FWD68_06230 [Alphaproteobacteria bacterium]|nr:hypothetical protein [Alphaproteobacteria bacterium]